MAEEEAQAEVAEAEPVDVEVLKTQIQELQTQVASSVTEAKGHQKRAEKNKAESARLEKIEKQIQVLTSMTADVLDKEDFSESKERKSETYLKHLKDSDEQRVLSLLKGADKKLKDIGLDMQNSDETQRAYNKYLLGDMDGCLEEVDRLIDGKKAEATKSKETEELEVKKRVDEEVRQKMEAKGFLGTDTGGPAGGGGKAYTTKEIEEMDIPTYRKNFPEGYGDVLKAIQEGRIKG